MFSRFFEAPGSSCVASPMGRKAAREPADHLVRRTSERGPRGCSKIKGSSCAFDTSVETIKQLRQAQVPDAVIVVMLRRGQERA